MECFLLHSQQAGIELLLPLLSFKHGISLPQMEEKCLIIAWGGSSEALNSDQAPGVLNMQQNVLRAEHKSTLRKVLRWNGIKVAPAASERVKRDALPHAYQNEFKIVVFNLAATAVLTKRRDQLYWSSAPVNSKGHEHFAAIDLTERLGFHVRRAMREAKKAVYALGLDFALVHIAISRDGQTLVLDVEPAPVLDQLLAEKFAQAMGLYAAQLKETKQGDAGQSKPVVLGADPEFILRNSNGRIVSADRYMGREGLVGCDAVVLAGHRVILPLVELRPLPSSSPRRLITHLRIAMERAAALINDPQLEWLAGGMPAKGLPLGGHIHFSGVGLNSDLLRTLDNYLALPLILLEGDTTRRRRPRYGFLGDFRHQPHGGFEYRTLPSWLISPQIAAGVLSLACVIANHYTDLRRRPLQQLDIQRAYYEGDKRRLLPCVYSLWQDIERTSTYEHYQKELTDLHERIILMQEWAEHEDFRASWEIGPFAQKEANLSPFMV